MRILYLTLTPLLCLHVAATLKSIVEFLLNFVVVHSNYNSENYLQ